MSRYPFNRKVATGELYRTRVVGHVRSCLTVCPCRAAGAHRFLLQVPLNGFSASHTDTITCYGE